MIPAFDVAEAELEVVTENTLASIGDADSGWQLASTTSQVDLWSQVPATWASPHLKEVGRKAALADFAGALGWKNSAGTGAWTMQTGWVTYPKKLVNAFKQNAFACPGMAKGIAVTS